MTVFLDDVEKINIGKNQLRNMQNQILSMLERVKQFIKKIFKMDYETEKDKLQESIYEIKDLFGSIVQFFF